MINTVASSLLHFLIVKITDKRKRGVNPSLPNVFLRLWNTVNACLNPGSCYAERHFLGAGVIKILLLIVIGLVVWALIRNYQRSLNQSATRTSEKAVENMVKCAHCGVNLPRSEAIYSGGDFFCTPEHKQLGKK